MICNCALAGTSACINRNNRIVYCEPNLYEFISVHKGILQGKIICTNKNVAERLPPKINDILENAENLHHYKEVGNRNSYSQYNEGWQDAIDYIRREIGIE